jgi:outer membrane protein OmpA-like peptidoglycan-associated protein
LYDGRCISVSRRLACIVLAIVSWCGWARAAVSVAPDPIDAGDVVVGKTGTTPAQILSDASDVVDHLDAPGADCPRFVVTAALPATVTVATPLDISVDFTPTARGAKSCVVTLRDALNASLGTFTLAGNGIAPVISAPGTVAFGNVEVGQSGAQTLTVTNGGDADLTITNAVFGGASPGDYSAQSGTIGAQSTTVAPGATTSWGLACRPVQQGARNATFVITSNALGATTTTVTLTCTGQQGVLVTIPTSIDFGGVQQGATVTRSYVLRNTGNVPVTGITAVLANTTVGYSLDPATPVPATLGAGAQSTLNVKFAPQGGSDGGAVSVAFAGVWGSVATATTATLALNGDGLTAGFTVTPPALAFGDIRFDKTKALTFCIVNTDQTDLVVQDPISIAPALGTQTGEFKVTGIKRQTTCGVAGAAVVLPQTLQASVANQILEVTITADPANRVGPLQATATVTTNLAANPTRSVALTANSTSAMLAVSPATTIDFGGVDIRGAAVTNTVTFTNTGDGPLDLAGFATSPNNPHFTFTLPGATTLQPGGHLDLPITYKPQFVTAESIMISHTISGVLGGPATGTVVVRGHGTDRDLSVLEIPTFPDTFRNPGDQAPVRAVRIGNSGEATLHVTAVMVTNDADVWQLVDTTPIDIPGLASHEFLVRFAPKVAGKAPQAALEVTSDDPQSATTRVDLMGNGIDRRVMFAPTAVDVGFTGIGVPVSIADALTVTSLDADHDFTIRSIEITGDGGFELAGNATNALLAATATQPFGVTFTPAAEGEFTATATLYLDMDPLPQASVELRGRAVFVDAGGGGGCSSGRTNGGGAVLLVLACFALRRKRLRTIGLAALCVPTLAHADNLSLSVFDPTPATASGGFQLQSPDVGENGDWAVSAIVSYASDPLVLHTFLDGGSLGDDHLIARRTLIDIGGAYAFGGRFEAGAHMPLYTQNGDALGDPRMMPTFAPPNGTARGDLVVHGKARLWQRGGLSLAAAGALSLPTATADRFTGSDRPTARVLALAAYTIAGRVAFSANAGGVARETSRYQNLEQKSGIAWGIGGSARVLDPLWLAAEMFGEMVPSGRGGEPSQMDGASALAPIEWLAGLRYQAERRLVVGLAIGRGVTAAPGAPALRGVLAVTFTPGARELAPIHTPVARKPDGDADGDGIADSRDRCPNEPEDKDLYDDTDGCPDPDNDNDGVPDAQDKCGLDPEDKDGFQDADGCPDKDNDADGLADAQDMCPNEPEDKDGFQDADGCPDLDNDNDGIADAKDRCPNDPETINGNKDDDGCPDPGDPQVVVSYERIEMLDAIQFSGTKIASRSYNVLGQLAATLRAHTEIVRVRVTSHVNPSADAERDQDITDTRAAAVREWLVQWGIADKRIEARGFGGKKPVVKPDARNAAQLNDRIEIIIMERK